MALVRRDEVLEKALSTDETAIPRFNIIDADGNVIYRNARLELVNRVVASGTPINKVALDEILAASGVTGGTSTAYTLAQENFALSDGAEVRFRLHTATGSGATLNVNGTGAKPLRDAMGRDLIDGIPKGIWLTALYNAVVDAYVVDGGAGAVRKDGDTMTGNLRIIKNTPIVYVTDTASGREGRIQHRAGATYIHNLLDNVHFAAFVLGTETSSLANLLQVQQKNGDTTNTYSVIHDGNISRINIGSITETQARQFVTAAEKAAWNADVGRAKILSTTHITTAAKQIDIPIPGGYTRYRLIAAGLSVDYSQEDSLDTGIFNLRVNATAQTVSSREYAWEIGGYSQVITSPDVTDHTNGRIGSVPASRSANSAYMQMEIFKSGDNWAGTLNGNGSSYDGTAGTPSGFCYATFTASEISTLSLVCSDNITAGMILLEGLA